MGVSQWALAAWHRPGHERALEATKIFAFLDGFRYLKRHVRHGILLVPGGEW